MRRSRALRFFCPLLGLSLFLVSGLAGAAFGQSSYQDTLGIGALALNSPSSVFRPLDMMGTRAGALGWSMGGAYVGQVKGLDAVSWNPAGLGWLTRTDLSVNARWIRSSGTTKDFPDTFNLARIGQPNLLVSRYEVNLKSNLRTSLLGGARAFRIMGGRQIVAAVSMRRYLDVAYPEKILANMLLEQGSGFPVNFGIDDKEDGGVEAIAASVASQVIPGLLSVGANLNYLDGKLKINKEFLTSTGGSAVQSGTTIRQKYKGHSVDVGAQLRQEGAIPFAAGIRYTPSYTLEVTGGKLYSFSRPLGTAFPAGEYLAAIAGYDMEVPALLSLGGWVQPTRRVSFAVEWDKQDWGDAKLTYRDGLFAEDNPAPMLPLRNTTAIHAGMELRFLRLRQIDLPVRFGIHKGTMSMADLQSAAEYYDYIGFVDGSIWGPQKSIDRDVKSNGYSMGFGFETGQVRYDLCYDVLDYSFKRFYFDDPAPLPLYSLANPDRILVRVDPRRVANLRLTATLSL